jgi:hypothetical protein
MHVSVSRSNADDETIAAMAKEAGLHGEKPSRLPARSPLGPERVGRTDVTPV